MLKLKQKDIREYQTEERLEALNKRLKDWQTENNTTACPYAYKLGLKCIGYSMGTYGCNGVLYEVIENKNDNLLIGDIVGVASRNHWIYID